VSAVALQIAVRPMTLDDLPAVMEIDRLSFALPWPERSFRFELTGNDASHLLVAEMPLGDQRRIAGYLGYWLLVDEMHISTLAVDPEMRGWGIGERLLLAGLEQAWIQGAEMSTLEVRPSNKAALALYRKHGFELVGRRRAYYQDNNEDALLMTLSGLSDWRTLAGGGEG
jgi:[ribosomal protein S18]-alanine N-acetyltransferase